jgi:hypothetical protein
VGSSPRRKVVVATGYPTDDFKPLRRRFSRSDGYVVLTGELPAVVRREMTSPELILRDTASPDHWMHWIGNRVLFAGADQPSVADRARERALIQRTGQLMYELSVMRPGDFRAHALKYSWDVGIFAYHRRRAVLTARTGNYPHHYFAFSGGSGGLGLSFAAARIILRHCQGHARQRRRAVRLPRIRE